MDDEPKYHCPKCNKEIKSKSGLALHIKQCCPELKYMKTTIKMNIEFDVPKLLEDSFFASTSGREIFNLAFWNREIHNIGPCHLIDTKIIEKKSDVRLPTDSELHTVAQASLNKEKHEAVREFVKIIDEIIGAHPGAQLYTSHPDHLKEYNRRILTNWPKNIVMYLYHGKLGKSAIRRQYTIRFDYNLKSHDLMIDIGASYQNTIGSHMTVRLADPDSFEKIREFTGLRPEGK